MALPSGPSVGIHRSERLSLEEEIRRERPNWEALYRAYRVEEMPWYLAVLDPDLERALERAGIADGRFLDLGTGSGSQAVALARRGFRVTASDLSPTAIRVARSRADPGLGIDFRVDGVLATRLAGPFDFIFDRGCLHSLPPTAAERYVAAVADLLDSAGLLFLKCFSRRERVVEGPARYAPRDIRKLFAGRFEVQRIRHTAYQGAGLVQPRALFCVLARRQ